MNRPPIEVADVLRAFGPAFEETFGHTLSPAQRQAMRAIVRCRTAALGGHAEECDGCGHRRVAYNSCRNRNCPKCQAAARAAWLSRQEADLLPVEYFHVVFTLPNAIGPVALQNPRLVYGALMKAAAQSLMALAADPRHLGAEIGFLMVLHTWGQTLTLHPHVHCVIPGGGLTPDGRWVSCRPGFFLPVTPLSRLFQGKFLATLTNLHTHGRLTLAGDRQELADPRRFAGWIDEIGASDWVVYAKQPFGGPQQVLKYLARYTHRVAISNHRLENMDDQTVSFWWKDYTDGGTSKVMTVEGVEFIRRFLQHVLPTGFVRIRHFGLLANRCRDEKLAQCRALLGTATASIPGAEPPDTQVPEVMIDHMVDRDRSVVVEPPRCCPACGMGRMVIVETIQRPPRGLVCSPTASDTS